MKKLKSIWLSFKNSKILTKMLKMLSFLNFALVYSVNWIINWRGWYCAKDFGQKRKDEKFFTLKSNFAQAILNDDYECFTKSKCIK